MEDWNELDASASANLSPQQYIEYERFKKELIDDGDSHTEAMEILTGFIWSFLE